MRAIFTHNLRTGDRLVVNKVAAQLGASATPVREALVELHAFGLVELIPDRGAVCLPFGEQELRELYHLREVLEAEATRLAARRLAPQRLKAVQAEQQNLRNRDPQQLGWSDAALQSDIALHELIAANCGSRRLYHEIERYREMMACLREVVGNELHVQENAVAEHVAIIDALLEHDGERAARGMAAHLRHTAENVAILLFPATEIRP
jgi:DNA-binding GntR family transcriptional regulator